MKEVEIFIGPCSKYITGQGWTTEIPVEQIKAKGYQKENAELQKQVDELKEKLWKSKQDMMTYHSKTVAETVKDTAKEILHLIKSSEYVDSLKTISIWAVEKIFKERYGVEVE